MLTDNHFDRLKTNLFNLLNERNKAQNKLLRIQTVAEGLYKETPEEKVKHIIAILAE